MGCYFCSIFEGASSLVLFSSSSLMLHTPHGSSMLGFAMISTGMIHRKSKSEVEANAASASAVVLLLRGILVSLKESRSFDRS